MLHTVRATLGEFGGEYPATRGMTTSPLLVMQDSIHQRATYPASRGMTTSPVGLHHTTDTNTKPTIPTLNTDPQPRVVRV